MGFPQHTKGGWHESSCHTTALLFLRNLPRRSHYCADLFGCSHLEILNWTQDYQYIESHTYNWCGQRTDLVPAQTGESHRPKVIERIPRKPRQFLSRHSYHLSAETQTETRSTTRSSRNLANLNRRLYDSEQTPYFSWLLVMAWLLVAMGGWFSLVAINWQGFPPSTHRIVTGTTVGPFLYNRLLHFY